MYLQAYRRLSTERSYVGMFASPAPLPRSIIREYGANEEGLEGDTLEAFIAIVRALDAEFLKWDTEERKRNNPRNE